MSLPKEPRQKMINLMYLVLTAMLALNVSAEILNAFRTVDNSLNATNTTIAQSTDRVMASLLEKTTEPESREKASFWYPKAQNVQQLSKDMYDYIDALRNRIHREAGFDPIKNGDSSYKQDNLEVATRIMINEKEGPKLLQKLKEYKANLQRAVPEFDQNAMQINLQMPQVQDKSNNTWESAYFHMVPTIAAMTILRKFQNDVKTTENKMVTYCHEQVGKVVLKFDAFEAIVGQNSKYFMPGQDIEITAGLGAFSKTKLPNVSIGGSAIPLNEKGMAVYKVAAGGIGQHTIPVTVAFTDQDGKPQTRTIPVEYTVGQANASIALDKMNVLYIGVENPITVAASGGGDDKVQVSISGGGGSVTKTGAGKYNVRVNSVTDDCKISVSVEGKVAGVSQFRVRTIPDPIATVGGVPSGDNMNAAAFRAQGGVGAWIKDFPFDIKYQVVSFSISSDNDEQDVDVADCQGNSFSDKARQLINRDVKSGRTVTIDAIRAQGPDGRIRKLPSLVYYIK
jgi:gliding motility-associated protein GldM